MAERIVSLLAAGTEILYALGLGDRVVGISHECDFPPDAMGKPRVSFTEIDAAADSASIDSHVRAKVAGGEPLYRLDSQLLAQLRPDLIITQSHCQVCAVSALDLMQAAESTGPLKAAAVVSLNPATLQGVFADIVRVGEAAGVPREATRLVAKLHERVSAVQCATAHLIADQRPRTLVIEWIEPLMIAANWMPELIEIAGGRCEFTRTGERTAIADWEAVRQFAPQVLVVAPCGFDLRRAVSDVKSLERLPGWSQLPAVRAERIFAADGNAYFNRSGPRIVDTIEILAGILHPPLFPQFAERHKRSAMQILAV